LPHYIASLHDSKPRQPTQETALKPIKTTAQHTSAQKTGNTPG